MERVLVTGASKIGKAGVATIVYKWGQYFDDKLCVYDYLMQNGLPDEIYVSSIKKRGSRIYTMDANRTYRGIIKWVETVVRENKYRTIHINSDSAYIAAAYIFAAKKGGIKNIYVHSHCAQIDDSNRVRRFVKIMLHKICRSYVKRNTKLYLACSAYAADWMFGKNAVHNSKYTLICNGVEVDRYQYNYEIRNAYRTKFGIDDKVVLGNIGRFSYQKNHDLLIDIFAEYNKTNEQSVLILVGTGELENVIKERVRDLNLETKVLFLGQRNDVPELLSAMDVLIMPSRFEGLPVTMVEAQMASLPCVVSNKITNEARFTDRVEYIPIDEVKPWITAIDKVCKLHRPIQKAVLESSSFNIQTAALELQHRLIGL